MAGIYYDLASGIARSIERARIETMQDRSPMRPRSVSPAQLSGRGLKR